MGKSGQVSPLRGEWIEIVNAGCIVNLVSVSPLRGEWIEINSIFMYPVHALSRLSEASGLKCFIVLRRQRFHDVSPLRGEWIEIRKAVALPPSGKVSPLRGEWIEIQNVPLVKYAAVVSPLRGEWIEIHAEHLRRWESTSLASQRRVD